MIPRYIQNSITKGQIPWLVSGVMRFNGSTWDLIDDASHEPVNVSSVTGTTVPVINYTQTFTKTLWFSAWPDEIYARDYQMSIGSSVGKSSTSLQIYYGGGPAQIYCNYSSGWNIAAFNTADFAPGATGLSISESSGTITVDHDELQGIANVQPLGAYRADVVSTGYSETQAKIELRDFSNTLITSYTTSHRFMLERARKHGAQVTTTDLNVSNSNIWFAGGFIA